MVINSTVELQNHGLIQLVLYTFGSINHNVMYIFNKLLVIGLESSYQDIKYQGCLKVDELNTIKHLSGFFENFDMIGTFKYEDGKWDIQNDQILDLIDEVLYELKEMGYEI